MVRQGDDEYLTVNEACEVLGVKRRTVDHYGKTGKLPKYYRARNVLFKRADVLALKRELETIRPASDKKEN